MCTYDTEFLDIVDDNNNVVGCDSMTEVYSKKLPHRIVHVFVLHQDMPAIYLQRRAATKSFLPNYYCTSAGGHVSSGESYEEAARRELKEEIGITTPIQEVDSFVFSDQNNHRRFIKVFITKASSGFLFEDGEVSEGAFFKINDARDLIDKTEEKIHPQLKACFDRLFHTLFDFYNKKV